MRETDPLVSVNILTYNRKSELRNTLNKVYEQDYKNIEVIVVDNASSDGTEEMLKNEFPQVAVIRLDKNIGAPGYNYGFERASGEYILILDDDSYPLEGAIKKGLETISEDEKTGIIAFNVFNTRYKVTETKSFEKFPFSFIGCGALIKKSLLDTIGYYSKDYFLYHNELDLSARAYNAGFNIVYLKEAAVIHNQSELSRGDKPVDPLISKFRYYNMFVSYSIFILQNFDMRRVITEEFKWIINRLIICLKFPYLTVFLKALFFLKKNLLDIMSRRKVLRPEVQKLYYKKIPFVERDFFPDFKKPF